MRKISRKKQKIRTVKIKTRNGEIDSPFFLPDATRGFIKSLTNEDLAGLEMGPMVVNTYHLYFQPGVELIKKAGGIHKFMNWKGPLISDSGGYQVFSLIHKNPDLGKITDNGAVFKSPFDGSKHILTPERSIQIQFDLGVDMMVVLDDPAPNHYPKDKIKNAVERTIWWAKRCKAEYEKQIKKRKIKKAHRPLIFGVIQGGNHKDLRKYCTEELIKIGFDGYGFGARHLDENGKFMEEILRYTAALIPENALRFALGIGTPGDIVKCASYGWDMFDCVIPTREGRHGRLFVWDKQSEFPISNFQFPNKVQNSKSKKSKKFYKTINITNSKFRKDFSPVDKNCNCETCKNYTKAYLNHLFASKDPLALRLASIHNLNFYLDLMKKLRILKKLDLKK
jgi:queuine tRNA-ribosyltransferase